jgi:hypothetical protein
MRCGALIALLFALPALGAVDTAAKRASVVNMAGHALPIPAGTVSDSDRAHLAMAYTGIAADEPPPPPQFAVPNVIGEASSAAADAILEADGFDLGGVTERCSGAPDDEVVGQSPPAGSLASLGALVSILVSNGVECELRGRAGVRLRGLRMPGL